MAISTGLQSYVMTGLETAYGTAVARDLGILHTRESLRATDEVLESSSLYRVGRHSGQVAQGRVSVGGDVEWQPRYNNRTLARLFQQALGARSTVRPDITSNPLVYQHTITPADDLPTGLSIEVVRKAGVSAPSTFLFTGMKTTSLRFSFTQNEMATLVAGFMGQQQAKVASPTALALLGGEGHVIKADNVSVTYNGVAQGRVMSGEFAVENPLDPQYDVSSRLTKEPQRSGHRRVTANFRFQVEDAVLYDYWRNENAYELVITFTGKAISGAYSYELKFTTTIARLSEAVGNADGSGVLEATASVDALLDDVTANELSVRITNSQPDA